MSVCPACEQDAGLVPGCVPNYGYLFGDEPDDDQPLEPDERCIDCGAHAGHAHHLPPCTSARCRLCSDVLGESQQAFGCPHWEAQVEAIDP